MHNLTYVVYILTNKYRTVLYTGITYDLDKRLSEHRNGTNTQSFTSRYNCYYLIYWEAHSDPSTAIAREKEIKSWSRKKKEELIATLNPDWQFLNELE